MIDVGRIKISETMLIEINSKINPNSAPYNHPFSLTRYPTTNPPRIGEARAIIFDNQLETSMGCCENAFLNSLTGVVLMTFEITKNETVLVIIPSPTMTRRPRKIANKFLRDKLMLNIV